MTTTIITCPKCGFAKEEVMPTDACQFFHQCTNCETVLKPKRGDCCVFCSYGSVPCPPKQTDSGSAATNPTVHEQVHAVGGQVGLVYVPWSAALEFHAFDEFSATARLQGAAYGITAYIKF
jgi:hypothetical protein